MNTIFLSADVWVVKSVVQQARRIHFLTLIEVLHGIMNLAETVSMSVFSDLCRLAPLCPPGPSLDGQGFPTFQSLFLFF